MTERKNLTTLRCLGGRKTSLVKKEYHILVVGEHGIFSLLPKGDVLLQGGKEKLRGKDDPSQKVDRKFAIGKHFLFDRGLDDLGGKRHLKKKD